MPSDGPEVARVRWQARVPVSLVGQDGNSVEPEWFESAIPAWQIGDDILIRPGLAYRVVRVAPAACDDVQAVLVVERE